MAVTTAKAYAKLNISLNVEKKRPDGYHDLTMVMTSVNLCDDIEITPRTDGVITVQCNRSYLPTDRRNHAFRAVEEFYGCLNKTAGADLKILKRIPVGAGLAGGSSDAAAVLRALNRLESEPFTAAELCNLGLSIGSDVPYCICGGVALAEGRGVLLTPLPDFPDCGVLICKPPFPISTADLFSKVDSRRQKTRPDTAGILAALNAQDLPGIARRMFNVFEDVLPRQYSEIASIRSAMLEAGALGSVMTGTGSAVFGLFDDEEAIQNAYDTLSPRYRECFLTKPVGKCI